MASASRTRYATTSGVDIAYQVLGEGPIDLLMFAGYFISIECMDDEPSLARFQRRLASFTRLIRFDPRGVGLSERGSPSSPPTHEDWVEDAIAVLDAVGSERAAVLGPFLKSADGIMLAVTHPERVSGLICVNGTARPMWAPDYPFGITEESAESSRRVRHDPDAVDLGFDVLSIQAPSVSNDPAFRSWWDRSGNLAVAPAMAKSLGRLVFATDVRSILPEVDVPTLVVQRSDSRQSPEHGRYLAEHIPNATYVELPGADIVYWVGDTGPMLDEIEEFVTGVRGDSGAERVLATVLFTDIVGSTDRAGELGDQRWRDLLDRHDQSVRTQLDRFRGREIKTTGDGFVATFDSPGRAIECAMAIRATLGALGIDVRAGIHTGEVELRGDDVAGMAVHIGARVSALADPGEVVVSSTVKDLVVGSSVEFVERGEHDLKGVPGTWRLFSVDG